MINRRKFLTQATLASLGGVVFSNTGAARMPGNNALPAPGLQLFTFFMSIDNDVKGTLSKIARVGYKNIESAFSRKGGYYGMKAREFGSMLSDMGLSWKAHHVGGAPYRGPGASDPSNTNKPTPPPMLNLRDNYQQVVDEIAEAGVKWLVCASTPIGSTEEITSSIKVLNKAAEAASKAGINFAYHNHDAEFKNIGGAIPYDLFLKETDASKMKMELDLAWAIKGGANPVELFNRHPKRFPLWHVKDLDSEGKTVLPVGTGTIDFKPIFKAAEASGLEYYFVEHDMPKDAQSSITESFKNLKQITG